MIKQNPGLTEIFINPDTDSVYKFNDFIKLPKLAHTLRVISEKGYAEFYRGQLAETIVNEINKNG